MVSCRETPKKFTNVSSMVWYGHTISRLGTYHSGERIHGVSAKTLKGSMAPKREEVVGDHKGIGGPGERGDVFVKD